MSLTHSLTLSLFPPSSILSQFIQNSILRSIEGPADKETKDKGSKTAVQSSGLDTHQQAMHQLAFWLAMWALCTAGCFMIYFIGINISSVEVVNWWVLGVYQLPLRWTPAFALGVWGYHYFVMTHADTSPSAQKMGWVVDGLRWVWRERFGEA
jgi:hypothetical protein